MASMGYRGLVVGDRDASLGVPFLASAAAAVGLPLLSANLLDPSGKVLFVGHLAFDDGPLRICAVAVSPPGNYGVAVQREDPKKSVPREFAALGPEHCQVKLLLAHLSRSDLQALLTAVPGFDLAAVAHDGWQSEPEFVAGVPVISEGQRGRAVARVDVVSGASTGPFFDLGAAHRLEAEGQRIDSQIKELHGRLAGAPAALAGNYQTRLNALEKRRGDLRKLFRPEDAHPRTLSVTFVQLDPTVKDDPALLKRVEAYQAKYPEPTPSMPPPFHPTTAFPPPLATARPFARAIEPNPPAK